MAQVFAQQVRQYALLSPLMKTLELGCGTGLVGLQLAPLVNHMLMVDTSPGMLNVLREKINCGRVNNVEFLSGDLCSLALPERHLDLIFMLMTLHHVPDTARLLRWCWQILKPGGALCIGDLELEDGSFHGAGLEAHPGFDTDQLQRTVTACGFQLDILHTMHVVKKADQQDQWHEYPIFFLGAHKQNERSA